MILIQVQNINSPLLVRRDHTVFHDTVFKCKDFKEHLMRAEEKPYDLQKLLFQMEKPNSTKAIRYPLPHSTMWLQFSHVSQNMHVKIVQLHKPSCHSQFLLA